MTDPQEIPGETPKKSSGDGAKDSSGIDDSSGPPDQQGNGAPSASGAGTQASGTNNSPSQANGTNGGANSASQNVVYVTTPKKGSNDLTPFQGWNIDPSTKEGLAMWEKAVRPPPGWKFPSVNPDNRSAYFEALRTWAERRNIVLFKLPTSGDGEISPVPRQIMGTDLPGYNLAGHKDILDDKNVRLDDVADTA